MTKKKRLTRDIIVQTLADSLELLVYVHAFWEGGAAAFDRIDEWSDIDLYLVVDDKNVNEMFLTVEKILNSLSSIKQKYEVLHPPSSGLFQVRGGGMTPIPHYLWLNVGGGFELQDRAFGNSNIMFPKWTGMVTTAEVFMHSSKAIEDLGDLQKLKMRTAGDPGIILKNMGVSTMVIPFGEIYESMEREHPEEAKKVIFTSGDVLSGDVGSFVRRTGRPFLPKPFTPDQLRDVIRQALTP